MCHQLAVHPVCLEVGGITSSVWWQRLPAHWGAYLYVRPDRPAGCGWRDVGNRGWNAEDRSVTADEPSFERGECVTENFSICWCGGSVQCCAALCTYAVLLLGQESLLCCSASWCRHVLYDGRPVHQPTQLWLATCYVKILAISQSYSPYICDYEHNSTALPVGLKIPKGDCREENFLFVLWFVLLYIW